MIRVRKSCYRGQEGWKVSGRRPGQVGGWPVSIFFEHESAARRHAALLRSNAENVEIDWARATGRL